VVAVLRGKASHIIIKTGKGSQLGHYFWKGGDVTHLVKDQVGPPSGRGLKASGEGRLFRKKERKTDPREREKSGQKRGEPKDLDGIS